LLSNVLIDEGHSTHTSIAPAWHSAVVLLSLLSLSALSIYQHGLPRATLPGLSTRFSSYLTVMVLEWAIVAFIWFGVWLGVISRRDLITGHWPIWTSVLRDLGFAIGFLVASNAVLALIGFLLRAKGSEAMQGALPQTGIEMLGFVLLSSTAGFCEEFIFRGYLQRQFQALTKSTAAGLVIQGIVFGVSHGYQGAKLMIIISVFGCFFGLLAYWRKSLRPGMLAHGLQDMSSGFIFWIFRK
jgi:membrane protease YdiL (CAAX protease family)